MRNLTASASGLRGVTGSARYGVWRIDLGHPGWDVDAEAGRLTAGERAHAGRGVPAVRRRRVLVRAGLRQVLGGLLELRPEAVPIEQVDGAPTVRGQRCQRRLQVSCSASGDVALIGVTDGIPIGVDVERIGVETVPMAVGEGWLSPGERMSIDALPVARRPEALTRAWVHKEAVVKGLRVGLRTDLSRIVTPVSDRGRVGAWTVEPISVAAGHVACLALQLASWRVRLLHGAFHELTPGGAG